ncbi:3'-5' exonuclease [Mumia sp. ZJ1417]|nr:3'-5' exonuclease [Mumia sp. ZJ1417]
MYAVIDTETTGLSPKYHHRIAEIGVVLVDGSGRIEHEWSTLVNPDRDLGPQRIHGIRAADARRAPRFEDLAAHLVELLRGRTLVAHNLPFDLTFLEAEYARLGTGLPSRSFARAVHDEPRLVVPPRRRPLARGVLRRRRHRSGRVALRQCGCSRHRRPPEPLPRTQPAPVPVERGR